MSWEEIDKCFDIAPIWLDWYTTMLVLNANIELESLTNRRNFYDDPYYRNYDDRYTPVKGHHLHLKTTSEFLEYKINTSAGENIQFHEHWKFLIKNRKK
jgi:hypothetical protein